MRIALPLAVSILLVTGLIQAQTPADSPAAASVRITVTTNPDGSRTTYSWDTANHKAHATTTNPDGKLREKISYELDDAGRFASGQVFGPKKEFHFATRYTYNAAGQLTEESQQTKEGAIRHRIVYSYDATGKQSGYAIYDGNGNLEGQTQPVGPKPPAAGKPRN